MFSFFPFPFFFFDASTQGFIYKLKLGSKYTGQSGAGTWTQDTVFKGSSAYLRKSIPRRNKLDHSAIIRIPLIPESVMKKTEDNTLVFLVDVNINKHQLKQAVKKRYDIDVAKVNTWIRPKGEKKAYVSMVPD